MNQLAVAIAIVLFPGLIAAVICDKIVVHAQRWDSFKYGIYSFLFGLLCYTALQAVASLVWLSGYFLLGLAQTGSDVLSGWSLVSQSQFKLNLLEVAWATAFAPGVAAAAAATVNYKLLNRLARRLRISRKYGDENLYSYFLNASDGRLVYVRDKQSEQVYAGRIQSFSETSGMHELILFNVQVYDYEAHSFQYAVAVVYLSRPMGCLTIEAPAQGP